MGIGDSEWAGTAKPSSQKRLRRRKLPEIATESPATCPEPVEGSDARFVSWSDYQR